MYRINAPFCLAHSEDLRSLVA